jgi:S-formylglutathione hydrolase FrmB
VPRGWRPWCPGSWYINSSQGAWEDYITQDVVGFLESRFPIRSGRDAHVLAGWSMGGFGSYNIGMKHPDLFRSLVGIYANLNLRYVDCDGHWGTDFDPQRTAWLTDLKWRYILGAYPRYGFPVNAGTVFFPAWGRGRQAIERMSQENPVELLDRRDVRPGQYELFVAYGGKDEYNVDAQIDSFLYRAHQKAIDVWVRYNPEGHHATEYVNECMPDVLHALGDRLRRLLPDLEPGPEAVASRPWSVVGGP